MLSTHSAQYLANFTAMLNDAIDIDGDESAPLAHKLAHVAARFSSEYDCPRNRQLYLNNQECVAQWLAGLPIGIAYSYDDIIKQAAKLHGVRDFPAKLADKITAQWFGHCAMMLLRIAANNGVTIGGVK